MTFARAHSRKAQITMFIIVGLVILLVLGLGVAAWKFINNDKPEERPLIENTNAELSPVHSTIDQCLSRIGTSVLEQIGAHGGYYDPAAYGYVNIPSRPTEGRAFEPFPGLLVPYWSYVSSPNSCLSCNVASEQPPLLGDLPPAIQAQARYAIQAQLPACINDFLAIQDQYEYITPKAEPKVSVTFGEASTLISLDYPIEVMTDAEGVSTLNDFSAPVPIPMAKAYALADEIRRQADYTNFFPGLTIETITLEATGDPEPIPPPYGSTTTTYDPGPFWTLFDVRDKLATALESSVSLVQLFGSRDMGFVYTGDPVTDNQYANYYFRVPDLKASAEAKASFLYFKDWTPYVAVHPGGQVIKPEMLSVGVPFLPPIKRKDFQYDVSYPLLVQLRYPAGKEGEFLFQFPLEVNMRNNVPLEFDTIEIAEPNLAFCDPTLATGSIANISVVDQDGMPLAADLRYSCVSDSCSLGRARAGKLDTQLPVCLGGELTAERQDYTSGGVPFDSSPAGSDTPVTVMLQKVTTVNVAATLKHLEKDLDGEWSISDHDYEVQAPEQAIIILTPRGKPEDTQVAVFPSETPTTMRLYPGVYDVTGVIIKKLDAPIRLDGYTEDGGLLGEDVTVPDVILGKTETTDPDTGETYTVPSAIYDGGLQWDETTKNVTITQEMLDRGTLTVPVIAIVFGGGGATSVKDLDVFEKIPKLSKQLDIQ